jgi:hypothetical protein
LVLRQQLPISISEARFTQELPGSLTVSGHGAGEECWGGEGFNQPLKCGSGNAAPVPRVGLGINQVSQNSS